MCVCVCVWMDGWRDLYSCEVVRMVAGSNGCEVATCED